MFSTTCATSSSSKQYLPSWLITSWTWASGRGRGRGQVVGRWILARLRHRRFFSLAELIAAIRALLDELNDRAMRGWGISRRALFAELDRPALGPLPPFPYEYTERKRCRNRISVRVDAGGS